MKKISALALALLIGGCATAHKMNRVSLGMTKEQVIHAVGRPDSIAAEEGVERLSYFKIATDNDYWAARDTEYVVILKNGVVTKYGRRDDLVGPPTRKVIIESKTPASPAIVAE